MSEQTEDLYSAPIEVTRPHIHDDDDPNQRAKRFGKWSLIYLVTAAGVLFALPVLSGYMVTHDE